MRAAFERRSTHAPRVPLDVLIELTHDDFAEPFEADGLNLSAGGLSMRAAYLPDVGTRLTCRFRADQGMTPVAADAEVVWALDSGVHMGEFGLRFVDLDPSTENAIRQMVDSGDGVGLFSEPDMSPTLAAQRAIKAREASVERHRGPHDHGQRPMHHDSVEAFATGDATETEMEAPAESRYHPPAPAAFGQRNEVPAKTPAADPGTIRLYIDGVPTAIVASATERLRDSLTVEQELPFLRLGTGVVDQDGQRATIECVDLVVVDGAPRLSLTLFYDDTAPVAADRNAIRASSPPVAPPGRVRAVDDLAAQIDHSFPTDETTIPDFAAADGGDPDVLIARHQAAPVDRGHGDSSMPTTQPEGSRRQDTPMVFTVGDGCNDADGERYLDDESSREVGPGTDDSLAYDAGADLAAAARARIFRESAAWMTRSRSSLAAGKNGLRAFSSRLGPALRTGGARAVSLMQRLKPGVAKLLRILVAFAAIVRSRFVAALRKTPASRPRRTTSAPLAISNVNGQARAHVEDEGRDAIGERPTPRNRRRAALVASGLFAAAAAAAYGFAGGGDGTAEAGDDTIPRVPQVETADAWNAETADVAAPPTGEVAVPEVPAPDLPGLPLPTATALPAPSYQAGPIPTPTYPSLGAAVQPSAPQAMPAGSPYGVDTRSPDLSGAQPSGPAAALPQSFSHGNSQGGRSYLLRMSRPVPGVEGTRREDGFEIRVPGSLALDRAGPIAASHPAVERAMILNHGDYSVLTIRFTPGSAPGYHVSARGSALEVTIGR